MNLSREQKLITDYPMVIGSTITCPPDHELVVQKSVAQNVNDVYRILRPGESFTHTYLDQLTALLVDFRLRALLLEEKFITQEREDILISLNATYKVYDSAVVIQQEDPVKQLQDIISVTLSRVINQHPFTDISEDIIERAILEKNSHELGLRILHVQVLSLQNWPSYLLQEKVARQTYQLRELEDFWRSLKDRDRLVDLR